MRRTSLLALALAGGLALAAPLQAQAPAAPVDSLALARQLTQWFYHSQWDSLLAHAPADDRPSVAELKERLALLTERAGTELWVLEEKFVMRNGRPQYWRTAQFTAMKDPILLRWVIDPKGQVVGMGLGPASQAPPIDPPAGPTATPK
ncbi:MAG TPA: hypothetical protein VFS40_12475 [Gemmatimonadales bacterium]|nr:hypothetical protein [Gemmatimonadales bacterium]